MKRSITSLALAIMATSAAFAQSSALDAKAPDVYKPSLIDQTATSNVGVVVRTETRARFGDGSPVYSSDGITVDNTASSSTHNGNAYEKNRARFGDGSPQKLN